MERSPNLPPSELLLHVSQTYRNLDSLAIDAWIVTESGDEDSSHLSRRRATFRYARPDRFRYEQGGRRGTLQVADGTRVHSCLNRGPMGRGPRCHSVPISAGRPLPHRFQPDMPIGAGGEPFLYEAISEQVVSSEVLREEHGCHVVAVTYAESTRTQLVKIRMPVLFWIDKESFLVRNFRQEVGHREPAEEEIRWSTHSISTDRLELNPALPEDTFEFVPPADALVTAGQQGFISSGGGGGFAKFANDDPRHIEHRGSHEWEGDTLIEHSKWKLRGTTLSFERRLTFSEGRDELQIVERATSPEDTAETSSSLRLK
jgi:outer membrane lipoprotein-sorting protein